MSTVFHCAIAAADDEAARQRRFLESQVQKRYAVLYEKTKQAVDGAIHAIDGRMQMIRVLDPRSPSPEQQAFSQFIVAALEDAAKGDVGEAMFAAFLLDCIPPGLLLEAVAAELDRGGRLEGTLDLATGNLPRVLQHDGDYSSVAGVRFAVYCRYLKEAGSRGVTGRPGSVAIIRHMFRTDPQEAFATLLVADYGFLPYARSNCYLFCRENAAEVRKLQLAGHELSDYLYRVHFSFPIRPGQREESEAHVARWSGHTKWWVRLFAAEIMRQHPAFRKPELLQKLAKDENALVRESAHEALNPPKPKESPPPRERSAPRMAK